MSVRCEAQIPFSDTDTVKLKCKILIGSQVCFWKFKCYGIHETEINSAKKKAKAVLQSKNSSIFVFVNNQIRRKTATEPDYKHQSILFKRLLLRLGNYNGYEGELHAMNENEA